MIKKGEEGGKTRRTITGSLSDNTAVTKDFTVAEERGERSFGSFHRLNGLSKLNWEWEKVGTKVSPCFILFVGIGGPVHSYCILRRPPPLPTRLVFLVEDRCLIIDFLSNNRCLNNYRVFPNSKKRCTADWKLLSQRENVFAFDAS